MDQKLVKYIEEVRDRGLSKEKIKDLLLKAGHDSNKVDEHLKNIFKGDSKKSKYKVVWVVLIISIIILGIYFFKGASDKYYIKDGWELYNEGKYEKALLKFTKAVEMNKNNARAHNGLGWSYYRLDNHEQSLKSFEYVVSINPNFSSAYNGLGANYFKLKDYDMSIIKLNKTLALNPDNDAAHSGLGWDYYMLEDYDKAKEEFEKALVINPDNEQALKGIQQISNNQQ